MKERFTPEVNGTLASMEKTLIASTLTQCGGNKAQAARILGISIQTLRRRIRAYGICLTETPVGRPRKSS